MRQIERYDFQGHPSSGQGHSAFKLTRSPFSKSISFAVPVGMLNVLNDSMGQYPNFVMSDFRIFAPLTCHVPSKFAFSAMSVCPFRIWDLGHCFLCLAALELETLYVIRKDSLLWRVISILLDMYNIVPYLELRWGWEKYAFFLSSFWPLSFKIWQRFFI